MLHTYSLVPYISHQTKVNIGLYVTHVFSSAIYITPDVTKINIGFHDTHVFSGAIYITPN